MFFIFWWILKWVLFYWIVNEDKLLLKLKLLNIYEYRDFFFLNIDIILVIFLFIIYSFFWFLLLCVKSRIIYIFFLGKIMLFFIVRKYLFIIFVLEGIYYLIGLVLRSCVNGLLVWIIKIEDEFLGFFSLF